MEHFDNRKQAGQLLAHNLKEFIDNPDVLLLALPRGGVPIGYEIAKVIHTPLDIFLVRKLGVPGHEELAMGAIAIGDVCILNQSILNAFNLTDAQIQPVYEKEKAELARRNILYRGDKPAPVIKDKIIILIDDGIATGATMRVAIVAIKSFQPKKIIVASPIAALDTYQSLKTEADDVICLATPSHLSSIGEWYKDFSQVEDSEVLEILKNRNKATSEKFL